MRKIKRITECNVKLIIEEVPNGNYVYRDLTIVMSDGFKVRVKPAFPMTNKEWGRFMTSLEKEFGE